MVRQGADGGGTLFGARSGLLDRWSPHVWPVSLVVFGAGAIVIGFAGRHEVSNDIRREHIVGTPDMKPSLIAQMAKEAGLRNVALPTCDVAGKPITNGGEAKCFASYMRIHALEATGGKTYSQMGRFLTKDGKDTNDAAVAAKDATGQPVENGARNIWVTETALTNALNTSFFAEQVAMFGIVVGAALLLVGSGLAILAFMAFRWLPAKEAADIAAAKASIGATPQAT
jgi:hypothetical protein